MREEGNIRPALFEAASAGQPEVVRLLIDKYGADLAGDGVAALSELLYNVLYVNITAISYSRYDQVIKVLLEAGVNPYADREDHPLFGNILFECPVTGINERFYKEKLGEEIMEMIRQRMRSI